MLRICAYPYVACVHGGVVPPCRREALTRASAVVPGFQNDGTHYTSRPQDPSGRAPESKGLRCTSNCGRAPEGGDVGPSSFRSCWPITVCACDSSEGSLTALLCLGTHSAILVVMRDACARS